MISPAQIKFKAKKIWESHRLLRSYLTEETLFPLTISLPVLSAKLLRMEFSDLRAWIKELTDHSKERSGYGYQINFKEINHRQLGSQSLPISIEFSDNDNFLRFIDKKKEYQIFCQSTDFIISEQPRLKPWIINNPSTVLIFQDRWPTLLRICRFMQDNPSPQRYIRELDIPDIDTKFIEQHKKILTDLFEQLLPADAINQNTINQKAHYFEKRYGFKHDEQLIRFRILDKTMHERNIHDISVPLREFEQISLPCERVFITENKINGLSFPFIKQAIVIFGLGYGIQSLRDIAWLKEKEIIYWGDIDTHGFAMLSQLRSYYPQTESLLMNEPTLKKFQNLWVQEPLDKRCGATLNHLLPDEQILYQALKNNLWGESIRLEQERISFNYFFEHINIRLTK